MFVIFGAIVAGFAVFHAVKRIKGSKKHRIRFVNITLIAVAAVCFALMMIDLKAIDSKRSKYQVYSGTVIGGVSFSKEEDGYYTFVQYGPFISEDFAVSADDAKLPWISKLYDQVAIYRDRNHKSGYYDIVTINGKRYEVLDSVVKIVPDYFLLFLGFIIIDLVTLTAFDLVMLFRVMIENKAKGIESTDENEEKEES